MQSDEIRFKAECLQGEAGMIGIRTKKMLLIEMIPFSYK